MGQAFPNASNDLLYGLTVVQRDTALLFLRELTFGSRITGLAGCAACGERLELEFETHDLRATSTPAAFDWIEINNPENVFQQDSCEIRFRLPTSADLMAVSSLTGPSAARQQLLEACFVSVLKDGKVISIADLPDQLLDAVEEHMSQVGAAADPVLAAACPTCGHQTEIVFDIVLYFWAEIQVRAMRIMQEVHALASSYGWSEADILRMSAWRRQRYLELVGV